MKIIKLMKNYKNLKSRGVAQVKSNNLKEKVLVTKRFDQYTGEANATKTFKINKAEVTAMIAELESNLESLKELEKDL